MPKAWHLAPNMTEVIGVDRSAGCASLNTCISKHRSPGINHQGVSVALATTVMHTRLRWSQHIGRVLDGPGLKKNLPVVFSGEGCECCRNHQQICAGTDEMAIKLRKPHVVANGQPHFAQTGDVDNRR